MNTTETFTFHDYAKSQKMSAWKRSKIGHIVTDTYYQIFGEYPKKIEVQNGKQIFNVNVYPIEFKKIIDNIITSWKRDNKRQKS